MYTIYKSVGKQQQSEVPDDLLGDDGALLSANVGDKLIAEAAREILLAQTDASDIPIFWREEDVIKEIDRVNESRALVMPGFSVRPYVNYPRLAGAIKEDRFDVPIVPMGIAWKDFPGDYLQISRPDYPGYDQDVVRFYERIQEQVDVLACREYHTEIAMQQLGFEHTEMVGDCAWYDLDCIGGEMRTPSEVEKVVFTDPHQDQYTDQAMRVLEMLAETFPAADRYCSFHDYLSATDEQIRDRARELGFEVRLSGDDTENLDFYDRCDLHVGYRCHGHIAFLRKRIPSVLLVEDGRGAGFSYSLGVGGFTAYDRQVRPGDGTFKAALRTLPEGVIHHLKRNYVDGENATTPHPKYPPDPKVVDRIQQFIREELKSGWRRYQNVPHVIDKTYRQSMKPFVESIP